MSRRYASGLAGLFACLVSPVAAAQTTAESEAVLERAPVVIDGREILSVRGFTDLSAEERAEAIAGRIIAVAAEPGFTLDQLRVTETEHSAQIMAGHRVLMVVFDADAEYEQLHRNSLAAANVAMIRSAIVDYRMHREPERVWRSWIRVIVATAVALAVLGLLLWGMRRISTVSGNRLKPKVQSIRVQSLQLVPGEQVWGTLAVAARVLRALLLALVIYLYAQFSLSQFPQTREIGNKLSSYLLDPLKTIGQSFVDELPSMLFLVVLFFVTRILLRVVRLYFAAIANGTVKLDNFAPQWSLPTFRLVRLGVIAIALIVAYPYIPGSSSDAFKGLSIFIGVLLSIGSSSLVANSIAGYALIYRNLFAVGDRVSIGEAVGEVLEMGMQVTRIRTVKNEEVIVPNSTILGSTVINYSALARSRGLILHTTVGIGYETPWRQVEGMLLMAAERTPGLQSEPRPFVLQKTLGDFCVTYELNVHTSDVTDMAGRYHALHASILDVFNEYGVQIMTPAYEGDPPEPKIVPKERWYQEPSRAAPSAVTSVKT